MKQFTRFYKAGVFGVLVALLVLISPSCQYEYDSPNPGIIQIRLKTISNNIPFTELNNFEIEFSQIEAVQKDGSRASIYEDLRAIDAKPVGINTLDFRARDSIMIIGETYVPPEDYMGIKMTISPGRAVTLRGYQKINVIKPEGFNSLLIIPRNYSVQEHHKTIITVELNLDSTLVKGAFDYTFRPYYNISSVINN
ncbi:MAG: hypothetical protein HY964_09290 [Ignavibacteriales bacterium]|nr:hypothetical protein [Ignavibacteriales bacterium]